MIYVVTKEGVYRHEIIHVGTDPDDARFSAKSAIEHEPDDYHSFDINCFPDGSGEHELFSGRIGTFSRKDDWHIELPPGETDKWKGKKVRDGVTITWEDVKS